MVSIGYILGSFFLVWVTAFLLIKDIVKKKSTIDNGLALLCIGGLLSIFVLPISLRDCPPRWIWLKVVPNSMITSI